MLKTNDSVLICAGTGTASTCLSLLHPRTTNTSHTSLYRAKGNRFSGARKTINCSPLRQELVYPNIQEKLTVSDNAIANQSILVNSAPVTCLKSALVFPDPSEYGLESLCRLKPKSTSLVHQNRDIFMADELFQDESSSTDFKMVMDDSNVVRYCEGEVQVSIYSSRFDTRRFIGIYSNYLFIYKSSRKRELMLKIKLDESTRIQRSRKHEFGICLYHYDQKLGQPHYCTITANDKVHQDGWIKSLMSAKQIHINAHV